MGNGYTPLEHQTPPYKLLLKQHQCPGDILAMTAAIECLKRQHPGKFRVAVKTTCDSLFENSPHVEDLHHPDCHSIEMEYPLIHQSGQRGVHFMNGFVETLSKKAGVPLILDTNHPSLYLSASEKVPLDLPKPYVLVNAGVKDDYTCKGAGQLIYQEIVDAFKGRLNFIQVGEANRHHLHRPLEGVLNMIGKTSIRELIRLAYHSACGVGPVSFLHHIYGAFRKPYVCFLGGREPLTWEYYPSATMLSTIGQLSCCRTAGCWKSRVQPLNDGSSKDKSICSLPVVQDDGEVVPLCMSLLGSDSAIAALETMLASGVIDGDSGK